MAPNRFYVHPGGDFGPGLMALGQQVGEFGEKRKAEGVRTAETERVASVRSGAVEALQTGDPNVMADYALANPEIAKDINAQSLFRNEQTQENYINSIFSAIQNPDKIEEIVAARQSMLRANDVEADSSQETDEFMAKYEADPEGTIKELESELAWLAPDRWKKYAEATGRSGGKPGHQTNETIYADLLDKQYQIDNPGKAMPPGEKASSMLGFKRAQADEAQEVMIAKLQAELSLKPEIAGEETRARGEETRASALIDRGLLAAESSAVIKRGLELLDSVKTGGFDNAKLQAKRLFGVEGADEGELSNALGKAVLSQLRETFGAQFTQEEGNRLIRLEAGFGKSVANNRRLLGQALRIVERTAGRARKATEKLGDMDTVADIDELLEFSLSTDLPEGITEDDITATMKKHGMTREQVLTKLRGR